jgi:microsomal dipeptidase-like Zn-dependent dipeptidase
MDRWIKRSPIAVKTPVRAGLAAKALNSTSVDWARCHEAGVDLMCVAHFNVFDEWVSMPTDPNVEAPANTLFMMELLERELRGPASAYARLARDHTALQAMLDVPRAKAGFRTAVLHCVEGGHTLGGDLESLTTFAERGVAWLTLTHFFNKGIATAANSFPFFPDSNSEWPAQGLSTFGEEVVREMERLGIIVDVTHCTTTALEDVLRVSQKPLVATHASARTLADHPYSLYDEHIQEIVRRRGLIGIILYPFLLSNYADTNVAGDKGSLRDVVRTIGYVVKICGTHKCVGLGSDFSGYITGPKDMLRLSEIDRLRQLLLEEFGHDENVVEDIMVNNSVRFLLDNWRSGRGSL